MSSCRAMAPDLLVTNLHCFQCKSSSLYSHIWIFGNIYEPLNFFNSCIFRMNWSFFTAVMTTHHGDFDQLSRRLDQLHPPSLTVFVCAKCRLWRRELRDIWIFTASVAATIISRICRRSRPSRLLGGWYPEGSLVLSSGNLGISVAAAPPDSR